MKPNKLFTFSLIATMALLLVWGCKKDKNNVIIDDENPIPSEIIKEQNNRLSRVVGTATEKLFLHGNILDEAGNPLSGATVKAGGETQTTDNDGYFAFGELSLNKEFSVVQAAKNGYFKGVRTFTPTADAVNKIEIVLQSKGVAKSIQGASGGILSFDDGKVNLDFPAGSVADADGKIYNGEVKVSARYINPESGRFASTMPGNLTGLTLDNNLSGMISYGMLNAELRDNNDNLLQIAGGKRVKVTMPAILDAPEEMPIWHFNETYGLWVQTETVRKQNGEYSFEANHFSYWNLDVFTPDNIKKATFIIKAENAPLANTRVDVYTSNFANRLRTVTTDDNGEFNLGYLPKNLGFRVFLACETIDQQVNVNSENERVTVSVNNLTNAKVYQLSGTVKDCEEEVYANKYFTLRGLTESKISFIGMTDENGKYGTNIVLCDVNPTSKYQAQAVVYTNANTVKIDTIELTFSTSNINQDINFCATEETEFENPYLNPALTYGSVTDIDGNVYPTIKIGNQTWMAQNLNVSRYNDGTAIPNVTGNTEWSNLSTGAWSYYDNMPANGATYGKLYNWHAVNTGKLCPQGWHIPTDAEWSQLIDYLGGEDVAGIKMKSTGNNTDGTGLWRKDSTNTEGTNESGFSGLPGGFRDGRGSFYGVGSLGYWWSSTEYSTYVAWYRSLYYDTSVVSSYLNGKEGGFSCRCARD